MTCKGLCFCAVCGEGGREVAFLWFSKAPARVSVESAAWVVNCEAGRGSLWWEVGGGGTEGGSADRILPPLPLPLSLGLHSPAAGAVVWGSGERGCGRMGAQREALQPGRAGEGCGPRVQGKHLLAEASTT